MERVKQFSACLNQGSPGLKGGGLPVQGGRNQISDPTNKPVKKSMISADEKSAPETINSRTSRGVPK